VTVTDAAAILVLVFLFAVLVRHLPRIWRCERETLRRVERGLKPLWPFGEVHWRGLVRALPPLIISVGFLIIGVSLTFVPVPTENRGARLDPAGIGLLLAAGCFATCFVCHITVVLLNWPKWVVPPPRRHEPGALQEWIGARDAPPPS